LTPATDNNLRRVVNRYRAALRSMVGAEAKAYGFTLLIWSTGAFLFHYHGFPRPFEVILFVAGAFTGMAVMTVVAFGGPRAAWRPEAEPRRYTYGAIHLLSVAAGMLAAWGIAASLPRVPSFVVTPLLANVIYQGLIGVEVMLAEADEAR
jgi:hypothetical protein